MVLGDADEADTDLLKALGPTLCAGVTAYKAVKNSGIRKGEWITVLGCVGVRDEPLRTPKDSYEVLVT